MKKVIGYITTKKSKTVKGAKDIYVCNENGAKCVAEGMKSIGHFNGIPATGYIIDERTVYFNLSALFIDPVHSIAINDRPLGANKIAMFNSKIREPHMKVLQELNEKPESNFGTDLIEQFTKMIEKAGGTVLDMSKVHKKPVEVPATDDNKEVSPEEVAKSLEEALNGLFGEGSVSITHVGNDSGVYKSNEKLEDKVSTEEALEIDYDVAAKAYIVHNYTDRELLKVLQGKGDFVKFSDTLTKLTGNTFYSKMGKLLNNVK